ncbi:MAG: hypothetical protein O7D34_10605 [Ignavibacteria bacterium]|nr:hypothetical protein [Ignavibacteria bacterium]
MRTLARHVTLVTSLVLMLVFLSCKDENPLDMGSPSNVVFPTSNVSYSQHVQVLFNQACAFAGCHDDGVPQGRVKLISWGNLTNFPGVVVPGQPELSTLVISIEGTSVQRMPPNGNPLNQNQINGIRTWIVEGAMNN